MQLAMTASGMGATVSIDLELIRHAESLGFHSVWTAEAWGADAAKTIQDLYLGGQKSDAVAAVPDDLCDAVCLLGPKERIRDQLAAWKESPATTLILQSPNRTTMETLAELCL